MPTSKIAQSSEQVIRKLQEELKQKSTELKQEKSLNRQKYKAIQEKDKAIQEKDKAIQEKDKTIQEKDKTIQEHESLWHADVLRRGGSPRYMHIQQTLHDILSDDGLLKSVTSFDMKQFEYTYKKFVKAIRKAPDAPLFADDDDNNDASNPGNRCRLSHKQVMLLSMVRKRRGNTQIQLEVIFGVDQTTVCRYLQFADSILKDILPTADKMARKVKNARTSKQLEKLVPDNIIMIDGTHTPIQRPQDKKRRKASYSGKKKRFTANTSIITNKDGLVLYAGLPHCGSTHDLTALRQDNPDLGALTRSMKNPKTTTDKVTIYVDKGYAGIEENYPGALIKRPEKKPPGKELTKKQKRSNKKINSTRITVEHAIGKIKRFDMLNRPYDGTLETLRQEIQVATGLANFKMLWDPDKLRPRLGF